MLIAVTLQFPKGYIGNPYWPAMERLISIRKASGVDRARSEAKREAALKGWLTAHGQTLDDYRTLEAEAHRPFYMSATGEIVIPAHQLHGFMAAAAALAPAAMRLARAEQIREAAEWSDLTTGKHKADGTYERFVRNPLTNQRRLQSNDYIATFDAVGTVRLTNDEQEKRAREFIAWGGREIGVGAARKMGWGRFELRTWTVQRATA
jgi:hypothetical protein